jgi:precorrin-8X/cobalt-precorrin-8 methylmutase
MYEKNPMRIEEKSFEIIENELERTLDPQIAPIVKRVIHTTADFEYADLIKFSNDFVEIAKKELRNGGKIYADTSMIVSGVNKSALKKYGLEIVNYVHEKSVYEVAKEKNITRSMAGIEKAVQEGISMYMVGNAPTAIYKIGELADENKLKPKWIIGVPVGFVGAAESKEELLNWDIPSAVIRGRKGGSPVAVAILNALFKIMRSEDEAL